MNMLKPEEAQNSLGGGKCRRVSGSGAEGWGGGGADKKNAQRPETSKRKQ